MKLQIMIDRCAYEVEIEGSEQDDVSSRNRPLTFIRTTIQSAIVPTVPKPTTSSEDEGGDVDSLKVCRSPVAGIVSHVYVQSGDQLEVDDLIVVLEAMKMETRISAPVAGRLKSVRVAAGQAVKRNQILADFE